MKNADLVQYELLFSAFTEEVSRFWSRFNILVGIQMAGFVGVLAYMQNLAKMAAVLRLVLLMMILYSVSTTVITVRGHLMHQTLLKALQQLEGESDGALRLLKAVGGHARVPLGLNQLVAIFIACAFSLGWLVILLMAEKSGYSFGLNP